MNGFGRSAAGWRTMRNGGVLHVLVAIVKYMDFAKFVLVSRYVIRYGGYNEKLLCLN